MLSKIRRIGYLFVVCLLCMAAVQHVDAAGLKIKAGKGYKRYSGAKYKIYFEGNKISTKTRYGIKIQDEILVPYKKLISGSAFNIPSTTGKYKKQTVIAFNKSGKLVRFILNKKIVIINSQKKALSVAPRYCSLKGKKLVFVPLKEVAEAYGYSYKVYENGHKVSVYKPFTEAASKDSKTAATTPNAAAAPPARIQSTSFKTMTPAQFIAVMGPICREDYKNTGILASVSLAQAINESGWGKTALCQASNNMFGMKCSLSGNTWAGSVWDQKSYVAIKTTEEYGGKKVKIIAKFRKYPDVATSVADHSAYLRNARNGEGYRYAGIASTTSYVKQLNIIKKGGYCTWSSYVSELTSLIKKYNLTQWDTK